ncbi:MAG: transketolase [Acidobacteriota bacterium]
MSPAEPFDRSTADATINALRFLAVDMVEAAGCGHPGAPMGQAALAYVLFARHLKFDPKSPDWHDRDRFVLSCGHASALQYGLLHLAGYDLSLDDLKAFRQHGSKTPGHPEYGHTVGVETTTGPLGQGVSTAVGMAMSEALLAAEYNREDLELFDHKTWVIASDGDLMEGVSAEAASLAGHLKLGKLNVLYDANEITIDGSTDLSFTEDVAQRYEAYGWQTLHVDDGNDLEALDAALTAAGAETERPTLVVIRTHIGFGSPNKQDSAAAHGAALGAEEAAATKDALDWPREPAFHVPAEAYAGFRSAAERGARRREDWDARRAELAGKDPQAAADLERRESGEPADGWLEQLDAAFAEPAAKLATRKASGTAVQALQSFVPLVGGSADLTGSNNTLLADTEDYLPGKPSRHVRFGVREHAMGAILNGLALSGLWRPYAGTFLIFSDYMRPSIRLAALMGLPAIYVFTHDSVLLGEDGPTHQPISQLLSLRSIPQLTVLRPADARETKAAWRVAVQNTEGPTAIVLSRQGIPTLDATAEGEQRVGEGAYVLEEASSEPGLVLMASGAEVALAVDARATLEAEGTPTRVVRFPSWELFEQQSEETRSSVIPAGVPALAIEAGCSIGWDRYVGAQGATVTVDRFGASAPLADLQREYGLTAENVLRAARELL